jgi:ABC-type branched-subunit amino acid transport system substrate-binding protein
VGVVLPLTGAQADLGKAVLNGIELGLFQSSAAITLYPYDTHSVMDDMVAAVEDAVGERIPFVIGPMSSAETSTIHAVTGGKSTMILSLSNDHTVITPQTFLLGLSAPLQTKHIVEFSKGKGIEKIVGIFSDTLRATNGQTPLKTMVRYFSIIRKIRKVRLLNTLSSILMEWIPMPFLFRKQGMQL